MYESVEEYVSIEFCVPIPVEPENEATVAKLISDYFEEHKTEGYLKQLEQKDILLPDEKETVIKKLRTAMRQAAKELDFESAASLRDRIRRLEK